MSFNYSKNKEHASNDSFWTSYSDLFLGLSCIFLLLYVTSSLRAGTDGLRTQIENEKLSMKVEEMENQLKMYESVKNEYMQQQASKSEVQEYEELMDKLTLLQEDAKSEKEKLLMQASENEAKVKALNKYQQMVRNVLNSNKMAKTKIATREDFIAEQDVEIDVKEGQINTLNKDIKNKEQLIAQGEARIAQTEKALDKHVKDLRMAYKANKLSKKAYEAKMAQAKAESQAKLDQLRNMNSQYENQIQSATRQLGQVQSELANTQAHLENTKGTLSKTQGALASTQGLLKQKEGEVVGLSGQLASTKGALGQTQGELAATRGRLQQKEGEVEGLSGELASTKGALGQTVGELQATKGRLQQKEGELQGMGGKLAGLAAEKAALAGKLNSTQGELAKAKAEIEARKQVAHEIQKGFAKAGVKADIDLQTGDVVLDFGQTYFDSDSDRLKREMKSVLEKAMPVYSKSLFGNPKISDKVSAVEIIGFASPTYQGRFVDPHSSKAEDKAALKYNMDLSYRRANSIFSYLLDEKQSGSFDHQRELLALMKVSGRSFLEVMKVQNRNIATAAEFCKQNDCKKAQRVIIRFSMDQKK
ncbi:microtubule-binding protein [Bdellovibrio bacteriovorus]|uniref:Microtubule-binding protein n=1 Tax=Bdellovibrio bacteriovorus TaxID=959 RepID=A0A150WF19_BDEBC|nr:microtubule-binding protein [Bdellovibrio bacteriovorus]KYG61619.1 microtubule-binding protein [Bdellovibrio bacteriovorus]